jgi:hypothetical protein
MVGGGARDVVVAILYNTRTLTLERRGWRERWKFQVQRDDTRYVVGI